MKQTLLLLAIAIPFIFQSCSAPKALVKLQPSDEEVKWIYGQEFAKDSVNGIIYEVAFDELIKPNYLFDFDITNRSNLEFEIDPKGFFYLPLNDSLQPITEQMIFASDPETEILELEKGIAKTEARRKNNFLLSLVAIGIDFTTAAVTVTNDNPNDDYVRTDLFNLVQADNIVNEFKAESLNELRDSWANSTIRKTTLEPSYSMQGKVFFPSYEGASYIQMFLPVDDQFVQILFQQKLIPIR